MDNMPDGRVRQGYNTSVRCLRVASEQVVCKYVKWITCCVIPSPKSLVFKVLYRLHLFFASNLACIVLHKRISTMRYVFANIHKIIVLSSSFLGFFHFVSHFLTDIMPYCMFCPTCKAADTAKVQCLPLPWKSDAKVWRISVNCKSII